MKYTIGTLLLAIVSLVLLTQESSSKGKPSKEPSDEKAAPKAPVSRYQKVSPNVFNEADGSIAQVNTWIRQNIADPAATVQNWGQVTKAGRGYEASVVVRHQNTQGGWVTSKYKFEFSAMGQIMSAQDVEEHAKKSRESSFAMQAELNEIDQQILYLRAQLEHEKAGLAYAKKQGKITSRAVKVENVYKLLVELQVKRETLAAELSRIP